MQHSPSEMAIRFWVNYESRNHIKTPSGKAFTLFNLPYYFVYLQKKKKRNDDNGNYRYTKQRSQTIG